jgi:DNA-binding phage protein
MALTEKHDNLVKKWLQSKKNQVAYLNAALDEVRADDKISKQAFLLALKNVIDAQL